MLATGSSGGIPPARRRDAAATAAPVAAVIVLVALAAWLRLWHLGDQPGGLYQDEAAEGFDAWRLLHVPGFHPLFFDDDGGREPLFAYLVAGVFRVAGDSVTALRATSAVLGILAVAATAVALRRFGRWVAVTGTAWAAGSLWLVCVDRDGFRNALVPLAGTLLLAALLAWADAPTRGRAALAGGLGGLGLWTYQPLKLVPLWVGLWLVWTRHHDVAAWARMRSSLLPGAAAYLLVAAPMLFVAMTDPTAYFGRGLSVSAAGQSQHLTDLPLHILRTVATVGVTGDPNQRHDVDGVPLLPPLVAVLALTGVVACWRNRAHPRYSLVLVGLPVFALPALVSLEGDAPHFLRLLGVAPMVACLVGLGAAEAVRVGSLAAGRRGAGVAGALVAAALAVTAAQSSADYLGRDEATRYRPYSFDLVALATAASAPHSAVIVDDYNGLVVDFIDRDHPPLRLRPGDTGGALLGGGAAAVYARDRHDLEPLGHGLVAAATVVARDPAGAPVVWRAALPGSAAPG